MALPSMRFFNYRPDLPAILLLAFKSLLSFLGILAIPFWLSIWIKNMFINIGIGLFCMFISIMLFRKSDKVAIYPYEHGGFLTVFYTCL